jgi:hypothetical protein
MVDADSSLPKYPVRGRIDRVSDSSDSKRHPNPIHAPMCLCTSMVIFAFTLLASAVAWKNLAKMHSGGVAGFAVMGNTVMLFNLAAFGIFISLVLALVAAFEIRAAWILFGFEALVAVLFLWLAMVSG